MTFRSTMSLLIISSALFYALSKEAPVTVQPAQESTVSGEIPFETYDKFEPLIIYGRTNQSVDDVDAEYQSQ